jgi:hypothetical protein
LFVELGWMLTSSVSQEDVSYVFLTFNRLSEKLCFSRTPQTPLTLLGGLLVPEDKPKISLNPYAIRGSIALDSVSKKRKKKVVGVLLFFASG